MGSLKQADKNVHEFVTEILDEDRWSEILHSIVEFLGSRGVERVHLHFGFLLSRELRGEPQPQDTVVRLDSLASTIQRGFHEGTIEWAGTSDLVFSAVGQDVSFMLCNDGDLHFGSKDRGLLDAISAVLTRLGIKVYCEDQ